MAARKDFMQDAKFKKRLAQEEFILEVTEVLCKIMRDKGISRKQLSDLLGKSKGSISQLLNGERNLTLRTVADILHVLGCRGLLTYKEVRSNDESKGNVLIFRTPQSQPKIKGGTKWEIPEEIACSDNYGYAVTSIGVL
jgi:transcriptional regulator with XRE-family HTH domain